MEENSRKIWEEFYNRYSRPLWFYIYKICGDENMADDIFQESCYRLLRAQPTILNENHMKSYLYKIAFRMIIDRKRRIKVEKRAVEEEKRRYKGRNHKQGQESGILFSLDMERIFKLLKPRERTLLWLAYGEGYSYSEIAEITETKENSVKVKLFRARKELANILRKKEYKGGMEP
jgi:RNA polymerase sigma-70 factor (ECF subfamily)